MAAFNDPNESFLSGLVSNVSLQLDRQYNVSIAIKDTTLSPAHGDGLVINGRRWVPQSPSDCLLLLSGGH